uniref:Uncharacterized protein n=1 Tax=Ditylenchus dipsaci TaxID=166011 RepID=A0A915D9D8_9BILA
MCCTKIPGFFFYLVRHSSSTIKNRTVKATVLSEIFFNVIPAFFGYFFNQITGVSLANYAGQFALFLCTLDVALCGIYYSLILIRNKSKTSVSVVSTMSFVIKTRQLEVSGNLANY